MKRILAAGGAAAGLLATAAVTSPAQAAGDVAATPLANTNLAARQVATFWYGENKANLIGATPYNVETKVVAKHVSKGGPAPDSKPGVVPAIGDEKKATAKSKNVNLPKTTGKVFFIGADHKPHWCSATSVQAAYRNLVATAGHCVYDTESNKATLDKWVFIPGYYQGKTPWGIYVGKQAFTHYDYDVYEDGDRDYAFVTVYNGVLPESASHTKNYAKTFETKAEAQEDAAKIKADKTTAWANVRIDRVVTDKAGADPAGSEVEKAPATAHQMVDAGIPWAYLFSRTKTQADFTAKKAGTGIEESSITEAEWNTAVADAILGTNPEGTYALSKDDKTIYFRHNNVFKKRTLWIEFDVDYTVRAEILAIGLKDVGRLGDNVGGQGLAYNQKVGKPVFVFGYPSGSHPDGNHAYTGKTLKWTYGKTFAVQAPAIKGEELLGTKSSFTGEGALGSSWLLNYNNGRRLGYLNGVTIGVADTAGNNRYDTSLSPYFDGELYGVYSAAKNLWSGKIV
ncbi:trypsin-like serine peptidase [Microtetraspora glauca]|uniref:Trypsin-like serine protease n=1 Tax=Microtetraspora glauca TaxID=1996 RepID=A0ABV3GPJ5_MICGL